MLSGEGKRQLTVKNNNRSNQQKSNFERDAHFFCTFPCTKKGTTMDTEGTIRKGPQSVLTGVHIKWIEYREN